MIKLTKKHMKMYILELCNKEADIGNILDQF